MRIFETKFGVMCDDVTRFYPTLDDIPAELIKEKDFIEVPDYVTENFYYKIEDGKINFYPPTIEEGWIRDPENGTLSKKN